MIEIKLFAALREAAGAERLTLPFKGRSTLAYVKAELGRLYPALAVEFERRAVVAVINQKYAAAGDEVRDGDEVALLPPVSGG